MTVDGEEYTIGAVVGYDVVEEEPTEPEEPAEPEESIGPDSDGDGVSDEEETIYGTDINKPDTDNDGFTDFEEIFLMGTDPLKADEKDTDTDDDGLTDYDEVKKYGTDINSEDTDGDSLSDYEEVNTYNTDPTKEDTDEDGLSDGFEVECGLDPLKASTDGVTADADVKIEQTIDEEAISDALLDEENVAKPSLEGEVSGELSEKVFIAASPERDLDDNRAVVGEPVIIAGDEDYVDDLTLKFDLSVYEGVLENLSVCKLDEDGNVIIVDSELDDSVISCNAEADTTYFVMDIDAFLKALGINLDEYKSSTMSLRGVSSEIAGDKVSGQADIVFVIDTTGSMSEEISNVIYNVTDFTERLATDYNVKVNYALIDYRDLEEDGPGTTKVIKNGTSNWFSNVDSYISALNTLEADAGGDTPECAVDALETARRLDFRKSSSKFIILITDADYKVRNDYGIRSMQEEVEKLTEDGINTSVVTSYDYKYEYTSVYESTGGIYADINGNFSEELLKLADLIGEETSDGEWIILKRGYRYVKLPELPTADSIADTDDDGINDYTELGKKTTLDLTPFIAFQLLVHGVPFEAYFGKTSIDVYDSIADPTLYDTDGDGISDKDDTAPWRKGDKDGYIGSLTLLSCEGESAVSIALGSRNTGHAFLIYTSDVNDKIDTGVFNRVIYKEDGAWKYSAEYDYKTYEIDLGNSITIGANGIDDWIGETKNKYGAYCATINVETFKYDNGCSYNPNAGLTKKVKQVDLDKLIKYFSVESKKDYSPFTHQCAHVATGAWKELFNQKFDPIGMNTPKAVKASIEKAGGKTIDLSTFTYQEIA